MKRLGWAALIALAGLVCGCNTNYNATPAVTGVFPTDITAGSQAFTLYIAGNNFQSNTTAQWNGIDRPVVYNNQTDQLSMAVLATDVLDAGTGEITVANPAPGGGLNQNAFSFRINIPSVNGPVITSISPASVVAGTKSDVMITVNGTNLASTDEITFNGTPFTTNASNTPVTLTATIGSENFTNTAQASIAVQTTTPGIASPSVMLPVGPSSNPGPRLSSIAPANTPVDTVPSGGFLVLTGSGFVPGSTVQFNGTPDLPGTMNPRPVGYVSSTQLTVAVVAADVNSGGTIAVTVVNPTPGGGTSSAVNFTVQ